MIVPIALSGEMEFPNGETVTVCAYGSPENIYERFLEMIKISAMEAEVDFFDDTEFEDGSELELYE